jgi:hypothetical protein
MQEKTRLGLTRAPDRQAHQQIGRSLKFGIGSADVPFASFVNTA